MGAIMNVAGVICKTTLLFLCGNFCSDAKAASEFPWNNPSQTCTVRQSSALAVPDNRLTAAAILRANANGPCVAGKAARGPWAVTTIEAHAIDEVSCLVRRRHAANARPTPDK